MNEELKGHIATAVKALEKQLIKYSYSIDKSMAKIKIEESRIKVIQTQISSRNQQIQALKGTKIES